MGVVRSLYSHTIKILTAVRSVILFLLRSISGMVSLNLLIVFESNFPDDM